AEAPSSPASQPAVVEGSSARSVSRASPAARRLAKEMGVALEEVEGTGPQGRITEADVRRAAGAEEEGRTMTGLRGVIARNMRESHAATAPVTLTTVVDLTGKVPSRVTVSVVRSTAVALGEHPALNGTREGDTFHPAAVTGISLAIQTDEGLVAPVVRDPSAGSLDELEEKIASLAERARSRRLTKEDYEGGTFSVTNLGRYGIDAFTPIINLPQVAILGVGALRAVPGLNGDRIVPKEEMTLSLTFDHAFVDGAPAADFLARVRSELEGGESG
ncbi:MAG: 2-oxo acid dehydrogenase subunit E2, partial [Actinomycetota bacterium]